MHHTQNFEPIVLELLSIYGTPCAVKRFIHIYASVLTPIPCVFYAILRRAVLHRNLLCAQRDLISCRPPPDRISYGPTSSFGFLAS